MSDEKNPREKGQKRYGRDIMPSSVAAILRERYNGDMTDLAIHPDTVRDQKIVVMLLAEVVTELKALREAIASLPPSKRS